jgi:replicative DNA helicase
MDELGMEIPPHSLRAEWGLLAGVLREAEATYRETWRCGFRASDFYLWKHRLVWDTAIGASNAGRKVTADEVFRRLGYGDYWVEWDGDTTGRACWEWLGGVLRMDPTGYYAPLFARRVHDLAVRRRTIHEARAAIRAAYCDHDHGRNEMAF